MAYYPQTKLSRYGGWIPTSRTVHHSFIKHQIKLGRSRANLPHKEPVAKFEAAIKANEEMVRLFDKAFKQAAPENKLKNLDDLLYALDPIIDTPPAFHIAEDDQGNPIGEPIGVPMYLLFDLLSNTGAAHQLFQMDAFNNALKDLLNSWGAYLTTPDSNKTLTDSEEGWFGTVGLQSLEDKDRGIFNQTYVCPDPTAVNRGYSSWDEFFTRKFKEGARPIILPPNLVEKNIIYSACESTPYRIARDVKAHDQFWLKSQKYSIYDMLGGDAAAAESFMGGTVYQAFLSPQDYHRWHSPINGTVVRAEVLPGTYYAVLPDAGAEIGDPDLKPGEPYGALIRSQAWITQSSARAVIYIKAENPMIDLVAFIGVGMAEVSTCTLSVKKDQHVQVGDELGMFHFGGSSHALIFGPQVDVTFAREVQIDKHVKINSVIAQVSQPFL
ncbi:phosphatidylserine decarboxylase [Dendrothele bispora CBS 962.96]|uniref:Phosphatidylserine decarboxylase n=1 Tax=Dendrothele bispora (strain CBS 962.96) TaxID=1314807 RepID=A0A4S8L1G4_DENBC|nr:phosphatidylserine decarboxylase [Dendrothele bispora CBS 962.96]